MLTNLAHDGIQDYKVEVVCLELAGLAIACTAKKIMNIFNTGVVGAVRAMLRQAI